MKKLFSILMLTALVFCVSSCSSDDDGTSGKAAYASVDAEYSLEFTDQMLAMCEITAKFTGENGEMTSEAITSKTWSKKVKVNKPVTSVSLKVHLSKKSGVDYTENSPYAQTGSTGKKLFYFTLSDGSVTATTHDTRGNEIARRQSRLGNKTTKVAPEKLDLLFDPATEFCKKDLTISVNGDDIY